MSFWLHTKSHIAKILTEVTGIAVAPEDLVLPPRPELGDLAFGCFKVAKTMGKKPAEAAKTIAAAFAADDKLIAGMTAEGSFVNITLHAGAFIEQFVQDVEKSGASVGSSDAGKGQTVMLEYAQPNTHKEMHVGHLRNLVLGSSLVKLLRNAGWKVIPTSYHGDVGAHVAKCLWILVRGFRGQDDRTLRRSLSRGKPRDSGQAGRTGSLSEKHDSVMGLSEGEVGALLAAIPKDRRTGRYLGEMYSASTRAMEELPGSAEEVSAILRALEAHDPVWTKLWLETRAWALEEFSQLFQELGIEIDRQYLESEVVEKGQSMVDDLLKQGIAKQSQGAIVVDLEEKKLGVFLIRKSDGTSLYATKDIPLAFLKQQEYPTLTRSILLVDSRQSLYFRQLLETLKLMHNSVPTEHVGYEFVTLKTGAMSSREGNVVAYQDFRDEVLKKTQAETIQRHADWDQAQTKRAAWALAMAGVKFGMLRQDPEKIFTFDVDQALSFEGDTGPYVQYAAVRLGSILKKGAGTAFANARAADGRAQRVGDEGQGSRRDEAPSASLGAGLPRPDQDEERPVEPAEKALALLAAQYGDVCKRAAQELHPGLVAQWCVDMAQSINAFYRDVKVLDGSPAEQTARLRFVAAVRSVLVQGLDMLGIPVPEEM